MAQLRRDYDEFVKRQAVVLVAGPEDADAFRLYFRENSLPFVGLPDPEHSVLKLYEQEVNLFKLGRMPAQVLIDRQGTVRYAHYGHSMADIPAPEEILEILEPVARLKRVHAHMGREASLLSMQREIDSLAKDEMDRSQREYFLRTR